MSSACEKWDKCVEANKFRIISFPKSGRTWLKCLFSRIGVLKYFDFTHGSPHPQSVSRSRLLAKEERIRWNIVSSPVGVLLRDPRDVLVSSYYELRFRS